MQFFRNVSSSCKPLWNLCTRIDTDIMEMWFIDCSCIKGGERGTAEFLRHLPVQQLQDPETVFAVQWILAGTREALNPWWCLSDPNRECGRSEERVTFKNTGRKL